MLHSTIDQTIFALNCWFRHVHKLFFLFSRLIRLHIEFGRPPNLVLFECCSFQWFLNCFSSLIHAALLLPFHDFIIWILCVAIQTFLFCCFFSPQHFNVLFVFPFWMWIQGSLKQHVLCIMWCLMPLCNDRSNFELNVLYSWMEFYIENKMKFPIKIDIWISGRAYSSFISRKCLRYLSRSFGWFWN